MSRLVLAHKPRQTGEAPDALAAEANVIQIGEMLLEVCSVNKILMSLFLWLCIIVNFPACFSGKDNKPPEKKPENFSVKVVPSGNVTVCQVTFNDIPEESREAAAIMLKTVESLVEKDGSRKVLAMAFNTAGDVLPERSYGGALMYLPKDGKILTMDERDGIQSTEESRDSYFLKIEERKTAQGARSLRKMLKLSMVFPRRPQNSEIKTAVLDEIEKLKPRKMDATIYIFMGNWSNPGSWKQVMAANGKYMGVEYNAKSGKYLPNWFWDHVR